MKGDGCAASAASGVGIGSTKSTKDQERPLGGGEIIDIQDRGAQVAQSGLRLLLDELSHHTLLGPQLRGRARAPRPGAGPQAPVCTHLFAPS
jgi:hypothetical protein